MTAGLLRNVFTASCQLVRTNAHRASLGKIGREKYIRQYQTTIVLPDGSTIQARTKEPRHLVHFPVDMATLTDDERRIRLAARKPQAKKIQQEVIDDNFDALRYASLFKKGKKDAK